MSSVLTPAGKSLKTVRFDMPETPPRTEYQILMSGTLDDPARVLFYLAQSMKRKLEGDPVLYLEIVALLARKSPVPNSIPLPLLRHWLHACSQIVSSFTPIFNNLVAAILGLNWYDLDAESAILYQRLLENLVSAHGVHVLPVAKMLVANLRSSNSTTLTPSEHFDRVHAMLQGVLALIPTGPSFMLPVITDHHPHKREPLDVHVYFLRNVLRMLDYAPVLRDQVLALILDRIVQVDVEIQVELEDLDDDLWEAVQQTVSATDINSADGLWAKHTTSSAHTDANGDMDEDDLVFDSEDEDGIVPVTVDFVQVVEKLDAMLRLVFQYIHDFAQNNPGDPLRTLFDVMLDIFERTALPTHRLRCTQFLWFYMCSLDNTFPELFMGMLVGKLFDVSAPSVIRVSASSYLGSFIARARYLTLASVRTCLKLLHGWAYAYVETNDGSAMRGLSSGVQQPDVERFAVFYSAVQAILYVFCFRWRQLMGGDGMDLGTVRYGMLPPELKDFQRVLLSRFAPLRVCSQSIVTEFTRRTHSLDIFYMATPSTLNSTTSNGSVAASSSTAATASTTFTGTEGRLDSFFPFDPVSLPVSRTYIDPLYQPWDSGAPSSSEEEESDSIGDGLEDDGDEFMREFSSSFDGVRLQ
ncbi:hypothetical protein HKX48_002163 [Thoreauomyces humboldtii]|nr:hypothetical protein HKX48_002163 [Thoreauomyces humboldtii]